MNVHVSDYEASLKLFLSWTETESLRRHAFAVEAAMEHYAKLFDRDVTTWRITGLLHDLDYEKHPEEHPFLAAKYLRKHGYGEDIVTAILGHADYSGVPRTSLLSKALFAVDELAGFITAVAYVRPTRLLGMKPKSVRKKLKDKAFAAAVSRADIHQGAVELDVELNEHISNVITGMQARADRLELLP